MDWTEMLNANAETFGEAITYTPRVGPVVHVADAVWSDADGRTENSNAGEKTVRTAHVGLKDAVAIPHPERRASILRDRTGETWIVDDVQSGPPPGLKITVVREITREATAGKVLDR